MTEWHPTWKDRQTYGREIPLLDVVDAVAEVPTYGGLEWRHIGFIATMYAESRFFEWARPMVWKPGEVHHLSVDRGICAFNSYWWRNTPDITAYEYRAALAAAVNWCGYYAQERLKGSRPWDWRPLLDWQWHAYGTQTYQDYVPVARKGVNVARVERGLLPL